MLDKAALTFGQMDEPPGVRLRVALSALTMAEYFRDVQGQDVLLFIDNIFRFTQAGSEVSTLLGRMPSAVGYQPTLADEMGKLQERITSTGGRSITSLQAVYVPADDYTDPAPFTSFTHFDGTTELSRDIAALGIYPAVDPLASTLDDPHARGRRRAPLPRRPFGAGNAPALQGAAGHHRHPRPRRAVRGGPRHRRTGPARCRSSWPSPCSSPRCSPACPACSPRSRRRSSFETLVNGDLDHLPEQAFFNVGGAEDVDAQGQGPGEERLMPLSRRARLSRADRLLGRGQDGHLSHGDG